MDMNKPRTVRLLIGILLMFCGVSLKLILIAYSIDYSAGELSFYTILALILFLAGLVIIVQLVRTRHENEMDLDPEDAAAKKTAGGRFSTLTKRFRNDLSDFFSRDTIGENVPVQADCTQLFRNILELRRKRLERSGIRMEWKTERRAYTEKPRKERTDFDGKYEVTEIDQEIESRRRFRKDGRTILIRKDRELAHYTVINAKTVGRTEVICPNCGCRTTRENLLDGCDSCGTRFTVEDLGEKISDFTLRDNADLAFAKFKDRRIDRAGAAFQILFVVTYLFIYLCMMIVLTDPSEAGGGDPTNPVFLALSMVGIIGCFAALAAGILMVFYIFVIFPATEVSGHFYYRTKKQAERLRDHEEEDARMTAGIQKTDPLFSLSAFRSNIQNKLSTVFYSETAAQINAFADPEHADLSGNLQKYRNVIDTDLLEMNLQDYSEDDGSRNAAIGARVRLHELKPGAAKVSVREETIRIRVSRAASSRTKAVCEPYVLTCSGCGDSLSLTDGLVCRSCGKRADLKKYDWVITAYEAE